MTGEGKSKLYQLSRGEGIGESLYFYPTRWLIPGEDRFTPGPFGEGQRAAEQTHMEVVVLSNEYPPHTYGGAGVHLDHLSREMVRVGGPEIRLRILCFGNQDRSLDRLSVKGIEPAGGTVFQDPRHQKVLDALHRNLTMAGSIAEADLVHCHTWYTHLAGCLLKAFLGVPLVLTTHSLEPHRPWKEEQLGSGYQASRWLERTACQNADTVIAVSQFMKEQIERCYRIPAHRVRVIFNGIDPEQYRPRYDTGVLRRYNIDPAVPYVLFVGRITYQKGVAHLLRAIPFIREEIQVVLCAGAPDTPGVSGETMGILGEVRSQVRNRIVWVDRTVPREDLVTLYSHATVFVCPSVYEPFGIINLEAMACETPVVAGAVGGIPEVVTPETGVLVPVELRGTQGRSGPEPFAQSLAHGINRLMADPERAAAMGRRGRERVRQHFTWERIARETVGCYQEAIDVHRERSAAE